jgi:hypothetical protein
MEEKLSEQLEALIESLTLSHTRAEVALRTMKRQRVRFGLEYDHPDSDIKQLIGRLRYMQRIAQRREAAEAATERTTTPERATTPD